MEYLAVPIIILMVFLELHRRKIIRANSIKESTPDEWIKYDFTDLDKRPKESGKYFVHRKDGKIHWEQWNGSGFAYNGNSITHFRKILPPNQ